MNKRSKFRFVWLIVAIAGFGFLLMGFLTTLAASHQSARIAMHAKVLREANPDFVPSIEQHKALSSDASALSHLFGNYVWTQLLFVFPVTVLAFIAFVIQNKKSNEKETAQPSVPANAGKPRR